MSVTFIQRSAVKRQTSGSGTLTVPYHTSALAGDKQFLAVSSFTSSTPSAPSGTGWKLLLQSPNTYSCLTIYVRVLNSADVTSNITLTANDWSNAELRTYRCTGNENFRVDGGGDGLVADSTTSYGWIIRCWASAQINSSGGSAKTLTPPAGLLNAPASTSFNWYDGGLFGDDPTTSGSSGTSTATQAASETTSPQWVNIALDTFEPTYDSVVSADTMSARYNMAETSGTTLTDSSGSGGNGSYVNSPTLGQASLLIADSTKKSVGFNGTSQYAQVNSAVADPILTNGANTCSVEAWFRPDSLPASNGYVISSGEIRLWLTTSGAVGYGVGTTGGFSGASGATGYGAGVVVHAVITYNGSVVRLFVNGVPYGATNKTGTFVASSVPLTFGTFKSTDSATPGNYFPGRVGEVKFYNSVLSPAKIAKRYAAATIKSSTVAVPAAAATATALAPLQAGPDVQIFAPAASADAGNASPGLSMGINVPAASAAASAPDARVGALYAVTMGELDFYSGPLVPDPSGAFSQPIEIFGLSGEATLAFAGMTAGTYTPTGVTTMVWLLWSVGDAGGDVSFSSGFSSIAMSPYVEGMTPASFSPTVAGEGSVSLSVSEGAQYLIQLGGRSGDPSSVTLSWDGGDPPYYDEFTTPLAMDSDSVLMTTTRASSQSGETLPAGTSSSVWARWQASASEVTTVETSSATLKVTVFEDGVDIPTLVQVATGTGSVSFTAVAGNFYLIQICE